MLMRMRRGFTVLEVMIAIFMIAVVSAAVIPALMGRIRDAERSTLAQTLFSLSLAVIEYRKAVSVNPGQIAYLGTRPAATAVDACNVQIGATNSANWRGPYVTREVLAGGINIGDSQIQNTLRRVNGPPAILFIDVASVDDDIAADLDAQYDGSTSTPTTGTIRYTTGAIPGFLPAAPSGMVNLSFGIPITGC